MYVDVRASTGYWRVIQHTVSTWTQPHTTTTLLMDEQLPVIELIELILTGGHT